VYFSDEVGLHEFQVHGKYGSVTGEYGNFAVHFNKMFFEIQNCPGKRGGSSDVEFVGWIFDRFSFRKFYTLTKRESIIQPFLEPLIIGKRSVQAVITAKIYVEL